MKLIFFALLALFVAAPANACDQRPELRRSPDRRIELLFCLKGGVPVYSVNVDGRRALDWSKLGFILKDQARLNDGFRIQEVVRERFDETWEQVWGEERFIRNHYRELKIRLAESSGLKRRMGVVFRVFDDGIGFRYEIPRQKNLSELVIMDELTEFIFAGDHHAWWIDAFRDEGYEQHYKKTRLSEMPSSMTPLTIETGDGLYFSIHEANLTDYSGMAIVNTGGGRLQSALFPWADGSKVRARTPMRTPWRTIQIGRRPGDLITSYLVLNLNEPNRLRDTSWIRPGKYIGIWWGMHIGKFTWGSGPIHGATTERTKEYIGHAKKLRIPAVLVEGWNQGWDGDWIANGSLFSFTRSYPDFDLRAVAAYARENGVELIGHHETSTAIRNYESQIDDAFKLYQDVAVRKVKTGYVGRRIDGTEWHQGQRMVEHQKLVATKAARHHIMLDIHEPIKDTGLRRTYPNIMTREGARGGEYDAWGGEQHNPPEHATILPFTRGLSGPFDYTPGIFDLLKGLRPGDRVRTTLAKQLALYVVIYSPLHMAADLPENYFGHPAFRFIQDVPVDWETTRALDATIGDVATIARKDRNSGDWYIGSVTDEEAREVDVKLDFLKTGRRYVAEIYRDRTDSHYLDNPLVYEIEHRPVRRGDHLRMKLAAGGGQAVRVRLVK